MSKTVEKIVHEKCGKHGLQVFIEDDGTYNGYCFACNTYVDNPYHDKPSDYKPVYQGRNEADVAQEMAEIGELEAKTLPTRKLHAKALEYFNVKVGVSQTDGITPETVYFPYYSKQGELTGYKVRILNPKKMWAIGSTRDSSPFGWEQAKSADGKTLYITEGEFDAVALFQILKKANARSAEYADRNPAVISLPSGASSASKMLSQYGSAIRRHFKEVVLVFDMDDVGRKAIKDALKVFPDAHVAELPAKDINDCLLAGKERAAHAAVVFKSEKPKNTKLVEASSLHEKAKKPAEWGFSWPFPGINEVTRGLHLGQTIYLGAGAKIGKSEMVDQLAKHCIEEHGWPTFMVKPEQPNETTYKKLLGKIAGKRFDDPKVEFDEAAFDAAGKIVEGKAMFLDLYQHVGWESLKQDIRHAAAQGCKAVFIDPITNLINGLDAASANTKLQEIAQELSAMAIDLNIIIFIFCHLRNPETGPEHSRGGQVLASQFAGSRAMERSCNLMLGLEGNMDPDAKEHDRNIRHLVVIANRETGEVGRWPLYWNPDTTLFTEMKNV